HALEVLKNDTGIVIDFENSDQLSKAVNKLLGDEALRKNMSLNGLHGSASTAWENAAILHGRVFEKTNGKHIRLNYNKPAIELKHVKAMTTNVGIIQFSVLNHPDIGSGYTLDDNARALLAMCRHYKIFKDESVLNYIKIYFDFIEYCLREDGFF